VVKTLLERAEVVPEKPDNRGKAPLSYATDGGLGEVVKSRSAQPRQPS